MQTVGREPRLCQPADGDPMPPGTRAGDSGAGNVIQLANPLAIECKRRADGREDLGGLKAFRRAYPEGESLLEASDVQRPFERELLPASA